MFPCVHRPETVLFAVDLDGEMAAEAVPGWSRFEAVTHAITTFISAKVCSWDGAPMLPGGCLDG